MTKTKKILGVLLILSLITIIGCGAAKLSGNDTPSDTPEIQPAAVLVLNREMMESHLM